METLPTWEDIERAALHCPVLHAAVTLADGRTVTREQALTIAALHLSRERLEFIEREVQRLMNEPASSSRPT